MNNEKFIRGKFYSVWRGNPNGSGRMNIMVRLLDYRAKDGEIHCVFILGEKEYLLGHVRRYDDNTHIDITASMELSSGVRHKDIAEAFEVGESYLHVDDDFKLNLRKHLANNEAAAEVYLSLNAAGRRIIIERLAKSMGHFGAAETVASFGAQDAVVVMSENGEVTIIDGFGKPTQCKNINCAIAVILANGY